MQNQHRTRIILGAIIVIAVIGVGLVLRSRRNESRGLDVAHSSFEHRAKARPRESSGEPRGKRAVETRDTPPTTNPADLSDMKATALSVVRGEVQALQLSPEEVDTIVDDVMEFLRMRRQVEASLPRDVKTEPDKIVVTIPNYPARGQEIAKAFYAKLAKDFPGDRWGQIDDHLGDGFDMLFRYFGQMSQTLVMTRQQDTNKLVVVRGAAKVGDAPGVPAIMSGTSVLTDEEFSTGEYSYLYPLASALK